MPRGGARQGARGKAFGNRTDLNPVKTAPLPATAAPNQPYGVAGAQLAAQKALPMSGAPVVGGPPPGAPPAGEAASSPPTPAATPDLSTALPDGAMRPGDMPAFTAPSNRPDEHVMTGVNAGPGEGSSALPPNPMAPAPSGPATMASFLQSLADLPGAPSEIVALAQTAQRRG